jgi:hypothetical protein
MKLIITVSLLVFTIFATSLLRSTTITVIFPGLQDKNASDNTQAPTWKPGSDIEQFWQQYTESKGGITWTGSSTYPEYEKVNEGDTFLVQLKQGPCLMEFFHSRWRRANDVRRWDDSIDSYGGCPYVFD